jgi:hypothetical protein
MAKPGWTRYVASFVCVTALAAISLVSPVASAAVVLGDATVGPAVDTDSIGTAEAFRVTASGAATVTNLNVYVDASSSATTLVAGVYSDSGGHPGSLLGQGSLPNPVAGAWNAVPISSASVTASSTYWLAILGATGSGKLAFRDHCCGGGTPSENSLQASLTSLPGIWSPGARWSDGSASIYAGTPPPPPPPDPAHVGRWSPLMNWPLVAIHAVGMRNGKVLLMDGWQNPNQTQVFDPSTGALIPASNGFGLDLFCVGNVSLADGRILTVGGDSDSMHSIAAVTSFDPMSNAWTRLADLNQARWYPTATELGDGRVLVISGQITLSSWADTPEIYDLTTNTWTLLSRISTPQLHEKEYPLSYLSPSGDVFTIAPQLGKSFLLDPQAQTWTQTGGATLMKGSSAQYRPGKILYSGGGPLDSQNPARADAQIIDLTSATPSWQSVAPMTKPRYTHTMTVLPDGKVLAIGGESVMNGWDPSKAVMPTEEWDPATNRWTALAPIAVPRMYHATALLMPDGRVLSAGGGHDEGLGGPPPAQPNGQFYSPPYLFKGARPTITSATSSVAYGSAVRVQTPDAASIASMALVSFGADTHTLDMNQHFVPLSFTAGNGSLTASVPANPNVAPPGYYMLFIVNSRGVPSVAPIIHVGPPVGTIAPTVTMTAPASGSTVSADVTVSATATDDVAVSSLQFLVDGSPIGSPVTQGPYSISWDSRSVANGSHRLGARASDPAGNVGTAAPVTITVNNPTPAGVTVETTMSADGRGPVTITGLSTSAPGDLLLAFVGSDGTSGPQTAAVTGAGLNWTLVKRSNSQAGDSEIWSARATGQLTNMSVTATQTSSGFDESLTVVAFKGAGGTGAAVAAAASSGAPSVTLTTTKGQSLVYAVGNDYDNAIARTLSAGQLLVHQWLDLGSGDTYWVQSIAGSISVAGTAATVSDTAPTADRWNLSAVEVFPG